MAKATAPRHDGYVNMLNKYGTKQDNSTAYEFQAEGIVPDSLLTEQYESNGLFAKIIDTPSEEAVKHGFSLGIKSPDVMAYIDDMLDMLEWDEKASMAIKWARLYGGALGIMFIDDGRGLDEPLDHARIRDIDEIRIYERAVVNPDYGNAVPEHYQINSIYGRFRVHESRCLKFRNGILPEHTTQPFYRFWGAPEYLRIRRELREAVTSHSLGVKMMERSVQAIYSMQGLASLLSTDEGENEVIKRLQVIDMARGLLNSIAIDSEGESYDFKTIPFSGVKEVIDTTCNMLSAVTNIPQTILFGRSPAGQNSTGQSDLENYYNYIERIQKLMLRSNLRTLLDIVVQVGISSGRLAEAPSFKLTFNPLWSLSESEQSQIDQTKAQIQQVKAQTAQIYVDMGALDPSEVRAGLAKEEAFQVEELLDDFNEADLWAEESKSLHKANEDCIIRVDEDEWRTTKNGEHFLVGEGGEIKAGLGGKFNGKKVGEAFEGESSQETPQQAASVQYIEGKDISGSYSTQELQTNFDLARDIIAQQGFDGHPSVVTPKELDDYISENGTLELYRGYVASNRSEVEEFAEQFRNGEIYLSNKNASRYGVGVYASSMYETAEQYAYSENGQFENGWVDRMTLRKGSKVLFVGSSSRAVTNPELDGFVYGVSNDSRLSNYAAAKGYDAIQVDRGFEQYVVILNRTAVITDGKDYRREEGESWQ